MTSYSTALDYISKETDSEGMDASSRERIQRIFYDHPTYRHQQVLLVTWKGLPPYLYTDF